MKFSTLVELTIWELRPYLLKFLSTTKTFWFFWKFLRGQFFIFWKYWFGKPWKAILPLRSIHFTFGAKYIILIFSTFLEFKKILNIFKITVVISQINWRISLFWVMIILNFIVLKKHRVISIQAKLTWGLKEEKKNKLN